MEPLKCADLALDVVASRKTVKACIRETVHLFCHYSEKGENVAFVLKDIGMLIIQGKEVKMRFYKDFLKRLNGTDKLLKALLRVSFLLSRAASSHLGLLSQGE